MEPNIFNFAFIYVLVSVTVLTVNAQTSQLAQGCTKLNNSTNLTTTYVDGNGLCNFFVRIPNMTYDTMLELCNTALNPVHTTCELAMLVNQSDVNTYIQRGLLRSTDKFLIGLRRLDCTTDWAWEYYNGTKVPFSKPVGDIPSLPPQNVNCSNLYVGYTGSQFTPVGSNFSTDLFGCICGVSNASASTFPWSTTTTMTSSIPFTTTPISTTTTTMTSSIPSTTTSISTTTTSPNLTSGNASGTVAVNQTGGSSNATITTTMPKNLAISRNIMSFLFIIPCVLYVAY